MKQRGARRKPSSSPTFNHQPLAGDVKLPACHIVQGFQLVAHLVRGEDGGCACLAEEQVGDVAADIDRRYQQPLMEILG